MVEGWYFSPGHRDNMMSTDYQYAGMGVYQHPETGVLYWAQLFGG